MAGTDHRTARRVTSMSLPRSPLVVGIALTVALASLGWIGVGSYRIKDDADNRA